MDPAGRCGVVHRRHQHGDKICRVLCPSIFCHKRSGGARVCGVREETFVLPPLLAPGVPTDQGVWGAPQCLCGAKPRSIMNFAHFNATEHLWWTAMASSIGSKAFTLPYTNRFFSSLKCRPGICRLGACHLRPHLPPPLAEKLREETP